jgi:hypothetical protein
MLPTLRVSFPRENFEGETLHFEVDVVVRKVSRQQPGRLIRVGQNEVDQPLVDGHPRQIHVVAIAVEPLAKIHKVGTALTDGLLQAVDPIAEPFAHRPALPTHHEEEAGRCFGLGLWATTACTPFVIRPAFASDSTSFLNFLRLVKYSSASSRGIRYGLTVPKHLAVALHCPAKIQHLRVAREEDDLRVRQP